MGDQMICDQTPSEDEATTDTRSETMLAFRGEVSRDELLASLEAHKEANRIVQGRYWADGRGCACGCTIHDWRPGEERQHALYEDLFGVPESLAHLEDAVFEGLPPTEARDWPVRFVRAIQPGADLSRVTPAVLYRIVERRRDALEDLEIQADLRDKVRAAIDQVLGVLAEWRDTGEVDAERVESAASAARYAAASARSARYAAAFAAASAAASARYAAESARSARYAAAFAAFAVHAAASSAAASAAESARYAAGYAAAASSAAESARYAAGYAAKYRWIADTIIEEIEAAPVVNNEEETTDG